MSIAGQTPEYVRRAISPCQSGKPVSELARDIARARVYLMVPEFRVWH